MRHRAPQARRALLGALGLLLGATPVASSIAAAQQPARLAVQERRTPRRVIFTLLGLGISGAAGAAYSLAGESRNGMGTCSNRSCVLTVTLAGGALVGYMIGREFDELHALRFRGGAPIEMPSLAIATDQSALVVAARDTLVAVAGGDGIRLYASTPRGGLRPLAARGSGVRGIGALDIVPGPGVLAVGSPAGFYLFPPGAGPGTLVREGAAHAVTSDGQGRTFVALGSRVESIPPRADTTRGWPGVDVGVAVSALAHDAMRGLVWAGGDSALVALRPEGDSLVVVGRVAIDGIARRVALHGDRVGVALAERGLAMVDARDPAAPSVAWRWNGTRFVYDVALLPSGRIVVAGGSEGLFVLDAGGQARVLGLSRDLGFVAGIVVRDRYAYVLDRTGDQLRRVDVSQF